MYTLEDLEEARATLQSWSDRFDRYSGNNPDKYRSEIRTAARRVRQIEEALEASGVIPMPEHRKLEMELDRAFPNAQSKEIVEFKGRRYQRRFWPLEKSRSRKTVTEWGRKWVDVSDV